MARLDKLTVKAQEAIAGAQNLANQRNHSVITGLHLLAGLLEEGPSGLAANLIEKSEPITRRFDRLSKVNLNACPRSAAQRPTRPGADGNSESGSNPGNPTQRRLCHGRAPAAGTGKREKEPPKKSCRPSGSITIGCLTR